MPPTGKSYAGEGSASFEKLEKPVWRQKGRQLHKFKLSPLVFGTNPTFKVELTPI